jgi:protein phosphatase
VREFCLYGETTGETDEFGLPVRYNWASEYRGSTTVVYGHTPIVNAVTEMARLAEPGDRIMLATAHRLVDLTDPPSTEAASRWWTDLTGIGGEGMVVKPRDFIARGRKGLVQPAVKCRGPEYLRIIYGPEYDAPEHLVRLRARGLGRKRSLAIREFLLGQEALQRFIAREPLRRIHEAVFAVLALESEPVDPRL